MQLKFWFSRNFHFCFQFWYFQEISIFFNYAILILRFLRNLHFFQLCNFNFDFQEIYIFLFNFEIFKKFPFLFSILKFSINFHFSKFSGIRSDTQCYNSAFDKLFTSRQMWNIPPSRVTAPPSGIFIPNGNSGSGVFTQCVEGDTPKIIKNPTLKTFKLNVLIN